MIHSISGTLLSRGDGHVVVGVGGIGFKVFTNKQTISRLPAAQSNVALFCHLHVREDALDLFGFEDPEELRFFELLISVSGVGPRSALAVLDVAELAVLFAAIEEKRADILTQASGIGRKTAERIVLDLHGKVVAPEAGISIKNLDTDADLTETLVSLGYRKEEARLALESIQKEIVGIEPRLKAALKILSTKKR